MRRRLLNIGPSAERPSVKSFLATFVQLTLKLKRMYSYGWINIRINLNSNIEVIVQCAADGP